jgi:hypothetical protein
MGRGHLQPPCPCLPSASKTPPTCRMWLRQHPTAPLGSVTTPTFLLCPLTMTPPTTLTPVAAAATVGDNRQRGDTLAISSHCPHPPRAPPPPWELQHHPPPSPAVPLPSCRPPLSLHFPLYAPCLSTTWVGPRPGPGRTSCTGSHATAVV